jgi:hypothetical protein
MRQALIASLVLVLPVVAGCAASVTTPSVRADAPTTLGRVVVYRNGVAYFERSARVPGDTLTLSVPADKVDDFLKSLDVVDARTGAPAQVAYPTDPRVAANGLVDMQIQLSGQHPHEVKLSYVTDAPAWKPSYRVVLGDNEKVDLAGWAVVDNTSGEDWNNVRLGVGASSALSFRFDLRSVRLVERETLQPSGLFAQAPAPPGAAGAHVAAGAPVAVAGAGGAQDARAAPAGAPSRVATRLVPPGDAEDPIGTSHFESPSAMTVQHGTSAMVSILHTQAEGEVVYLYDPESPRGSAQLAFKSLRLRNPTDSQLEAGPFTVFGEGRLIGEGLSEPIPPKQLAFVPFALDRQVVVDRSESERDEIVSISAAARGIFSTRAQHIKRTTLVVHNRLPTRAVVYVRHGVPAGYRASKAPTDPEHAAGADLYRVVVDGFGKQEVVLEEAAPVARVSDIRTQQGMDLVRAYLAQGTRDAKLKAQVDALATIEEGIADTDRRSAALRTQLAEYRQRTDDLKAQIAALKGVRTAGALAATLQAKLKEVGDKSTRATADLAALDEKALLGRIELQDHAADLSLDEGVAAAGLASRGE